MKRYIVYTNNIQIDIPKFQHDNGKYFSYTEMFITVYFIFGIPFRTTLASHT